MRTIKIDRSKWRCGADSNNPKNTCGTGETALLNDEGFMCCLGFASQQLSRKPKVKLLHMSFPENLNFVVSPLSMRNEINCIIDTEFTHDAANINDNANTSLKQKESRLVKLFAKHDLELQFTGEYNG